MTQAASGIILLDTTDDTSTPGDNSGWQYEGQFNGFLGTPIAPYFFLTANHIGGTVGDSLILHGESFTTIATYQDLDDQGNGRTDLRIWEVSHDHPFVCYAPLYFEDQANDETGQELRVFGRGTERGDPVYLNGTLRGWNWGDWDGVQRWGRNLVTDIVQDDDSHPYWFFLQAAFDSPGLVHEAHLSTGDSGGGVFILEDGLWRLAGINYGVDDVYILSSDSNNDPVYTDYVAALFDERGYYTLNTDKSYTEITGDQNVPTSFYSTQVSTRLDWIEGITGIVPSALPAEDFGSWQHAYFTPDQIADDTISGPGADPDGDGIPNLLEFAFDLDPGFAEPAIMVAGTGLRGLPLIQLEQIAPSDSRLTVEFVAAAPTTAARV